MATNFWELLQQHQGDLTKSGRTVADYLVQHAAEAQYLSISSLAKECCVAEATVFRFCRALGFEGYHEMRIALAQANATGALVNQHVPEPDADTATLCEHASALLMTTINGTQNNLSPEAVDKASELMHKARQVYCLGQGGSMYIANDICARFACISTKFRTAGDSHMQLITASLMTPEDVVLFVSYSGATRDMLETLRVAKAAGAKIIGVNNRNLKDFTVDTANSRKLRDLIPDDIIFVSESGVKSTDDIRAIREIGADAVLIGETLMRADDKKAKLDELRLS